MFTDDVLPGLRPRPLAGPSGRPVVHVRPRRSSRILVLAVRALRARRDRERHPQRQGERNRRPRRARRV